MGEVITTENRKSSKFFGDKAFYKTILALAIPIMIQNGITNFVSMLDNVMVGRIGELQMTGVAVANQLFFVLNLCIFGVVSGAGIFGAQFAGKKDKDGLVHTFRFKMLLCTGIAALGILVLYFFGEPLINLYLQGEGKPEDIAATFMYARKYMLIILISLLPFSWSQGYASTLRENGQTLIPMIASVIAVFLNLVLNYILIFGKLGLPALGCVGAAIATVIARFVEFLVCAIWTHTNVKEECTLFARGAYKSLYVPAALAKSIIIKGLPLILNETLWAAGMAAVTQCYSTRGLTVMAGMNIQNTFFQVFCVSFMAIGATVGIVLGQQLGAGEIQKARESSTKLITLSALISACVLDIYMLLAQFIPQLYNISDEVRVMATRFMQIAAIMMPADAIANASYFTIRSGGKMFITILFDCCFVWVFCVTTAYTLANFTDLSIYSIYLIVQSLTILKAFLAILYVRTGKWAVNIVTN